MHLKKRVLYLHFDTVIFQIKEIYFESKHLIIFDISAYRVLGNKVFEIPQPIFLFLPFKVFYYIHTLEAKSNFTSKSLVNLESFRDKIFILT